MGAAANGEAGTAQDRSTAAQTARDRPMRHALATKTTAQVSAFHSSTLLKIFFK